MQKTIFTIICLTFFTSFLGAQKSLKQYKQQTTFFHTQLNLHGGWLSDNSGERWDLYPSAPSNQLAFRLMKKDQRTMQRGYTRTLSPSVYSMRFATPFGRTVDANGEWSANAKLVLLDTWIKFNTKWDRTYIWIGKKAIPYGHNPMMDRVTSFMTNLVQMDLGFFQDIGLFLKTPINRKYDLELSITTGGFFKQPVLKWDNMLSSSQDSESVVEVSNHSYDNTWLVTGRLGNQSFRKNEIGLIGVVGQIQNNFTAIAARHVSRIGVDWIHKHREKIKFGNQLTFGLTGTEFDGLYSTLNYQGNVDLYITSRVVINVSIAGTYNNSQNSDTYYLNLTNANSLSYVFSPNTRIKINGYFSRRPELNENQSGVLFQFVTGIGKRN